MEKGELIRFRLIDDHKAECTYRFSDGSIQVKILSYVRKSNKN